LPPPSEEQLAAIAKRKASISSRINDTQNKRVKLDHSNYPNDGVKPKKDFGDEDNNPSSILDSDAICVKCKFEGKVKMFKATTNMATKSLIKQILLKFELTDENSFSTDEKNYRLHYYDDSNDEIELENSDDLLLFLISPTVSNKLLFLTKYQ